MSSGARMQELTTPRPVEPGEIRRALAELWRTAGGQEYREAGDLVARACGLTVLGIAADEEDLVRVATALDVAADAAPARTLIVQADADVDAIRADVSAVCSLRGSAGRQVCREQVVLRAPRSERARLAPLLAPLPVADLPVVLCVLSGSLLGEEFVQRLLPLADVVVLDSSLARDAAIAFAAAAALPTRRLAVRDLAFERLATWRLAVAMAWDRFAEEGATLERAEIRSGPYAAEALLLAGWIDACLDRTDVARVVVDADADEEAPPGLRELRLTAAGRGIARACTFRRAGDFLVRDPGDAPDAAEPCELPRPLPDASFLLAGVLADPRGDPMFDRALRHAERRARDLGTGP